MHRFVVCAAAALTVITSTFACEPGQPPGQPEADSALQDSAKTLVRESLKDPDSAQFKQLSVVTNSMGEESVCGEYNARNSFGGYVGFKPFGVSAQLLVTDPLQLERMGCSGAEAERSRRQSDAENALVKGFEEEAAFNCNVIWTLLDNHIKNGEVAEAALEAAMTATTNRARQNGTEIQPAMLQDIRNQYRASLSTTAADKVASKSIKRGDDVFKLQFMFSCKAQTVRLMKLNAGVK